MVFLCGAPEYKMEEGVTRSLLPTHCLGALLTHFLGHE